MTLSTVDDLRDLAVQLRAERERLGRECARHVKEHGDDPVAYGLADRWLVLDGEVRNVERLIAQETTGGSL